MSVNDMLFHEQPEHKTGDSRQYEGGPSAFRAVWLQKKMKEANLGGTGLVIMAESQMAKNIARNYPEAWVVDSGYDDLGHFRREELAQKYPEHTWVIITRNGGSTPMVSVENIQTGEILPNDQSVYLDESWGNGANPFAEKIQSIKNVGMNNGNS